MDWITSEVTTTQYPNGEWSRATLRYLDVQSVRVWQVEVLAARLHYDAEQGYYTDELHETSVTKEFTDKGDAMVKYREVR